MDRFDVTSNHPTMMAVVTTGNGGYDNLDFREVPIPVALKSRRLPGLQKLDQS